MSILQCDQCKSVLEEPVSLPCGFTICARHVTNSLPQQPQQQCAFCHSVHHDPCVKNMKLARLLDVFNRARSACERLGRETRAYHALKIKPLDVINEHFDALEKLVLSERDRVLEYVHAQVEARTRACLARVEDARERCVSSLECKPEPGFYDDLREINGKLDEFEAVLRGDKCAEDVWDKIVHTSDSLSHDVSVSSRSF